MNTSPSASELISESAALEQAGEIAAALKKAVLAHAVAIQIEDRDAAGEALLAMAQAHVRLGDYAETRRLCARAIEIAEADSPLQPGAWRLLGICALESDDMAGGETLLRRAIAFSRRIGHDRLLARCLHSLSAGIYMPRGQFALSLAADEEALRICRQRGFSDLEWGPLLTMSWVYWLSAEPVHSEAMLVELERVALPGSLADGYVHCIRASLALDRGDLASAEPALVKTLSVAEVLGSPELRVLGRLARSRRSRLNGDGPAAAAWAGDALRIAEDSGYCHLQGLALIERGRATWENGDAIKAETDWRQTLEMLDPLGLAYDATRAALLLAALLHREHSPLAMHAWQEAVRRIVDGGFVCLVDTEPALFAMLLPTYTQHPDPASARAAMSLLERFRRLAPPPLKIVTLGGLQVWTGSRMVDRHSLRQRRSGELLAMLLLAPGHVVSFDRVADAFWPDKDPRAALTLFHHATSALRHALEPELPERFSSRYLAVNEGQVSLHLPAGSRLDWEVFVAHCQRQEWEAALTLCTGEFLPEYAYSDWSAILRQDLSQRFQHALLAYARDRVQRGHYQEAMDACQRLLAVEPWHEEAVLTGMRASLELGDRARARRLYRTLETRLRDDLDTVPAEELQSLYRSINPHPRS